MTDAIGGAAQFSTPLKLAVAIGLALAIDAAIGDPAFRLHPVRLLGALAAKAESSARRILAPEGSTRSPASLRMAGMAAWIAVMLAATVSAITASAIAGRVDWRAGIAVDALIIWASIAPTDLARHAMRVARALARDDASGLAEPLAGRAAVSRIVGRDVEALDRAGVSRAAVESVAESSVDGVAAPLFWACVLGPWGAFAYRAVNTMDSIYGHRNARYIFFGTVAARADDAANWLPARVSSVLACLVAPLCGGRLRGAFSSFRKYRLAHASPNAGHPESAYAGALGIRLGGPVSYPEGIADKPFMNPAGRDARPDDIRRAVRLMYAQTVASAAAFVGTYWYLYGLIWSMAA